MSDRLYIFCFDIESTGTNPAEDRIVEIAHAEMTPPLGLAPPQVSVERFNPGVPIPEEATEVHGISDEDVADKPPFERLARMYQEYINRAEYLLHYNGRTFDTLMLDAELRRAGCEGVDLEGQKEIDLYRVWRELEPRSLEGALQRFAPEALDDHEAHTAAGDMEALTPLLWGMTDHYRDELNDEEGDLSFERLVELSTPENEVDRSGKLTRNEDGEVCFAVGKHKGKPVLEHWDYAEWMLREKEDDHPPDTKAALREVLRERDESLTGREIGGKA